MWAKALRGLFCNTRVVLYMLRGTHVEGLPALKSRLLLLRGSRALLKKLSL